MSEWRFFANYPAPEVHNGPVISFPKLDVVLCLLALLVICATGCTNQSAAGIPITRSGILLPKYSDEWGLVSGTDVFFVRGNPNQLAKFERRRVSIKGTVDGVKQLTAESLSPDELSEGEIRALVEQLRGDGWSTPYSETNPTIWHFNFTDPMLQLLQAGPSAQRILLSYLSDQQIKDHIIILLGGLGDERSVEPIIQVMPDKGVNSEQKRLNLIANLALTNITVSEVIWHHGGGITIPNCPDTAKSCWAAWWLRNKDTFNVTQTPSRNYSNYPNYGIYMQL